MSTLSIPPRTQLLSIERFSSQAHYDYAIWINTNTVELRKPHRQRQGTYLFLDGRSGVIQRVTVDGDVVNIIDVMDN